MEVTLSKNARSVGYAASSEHTRPVLQYARIGEGRIVAADGNILARHPVDCNDDGDSLLIDAKALLTCKDNKATGSVAVHNNGDRVVTLVGQEKVTTYCISENYPKYQELFDKLEPPVVKIAFGVKLLKKMLQTLGDAENVILEFTSPTSPCHFIAGDTDGLIMPVYKQW